MTGNELVLDDDEMRVEGGEFFMRVKKKGFRSSFFVPIHELCEQEKLLKFSKKDIIKIISLNSTSEKKSIFYKKETKKGNYAPLIFLISLLFTVFISTNTLGFKLVEFNFWGVKYIRGAGFWWPAMYLLSAIITENYGYAVNRILNWNLFGCSIISCFFAAATLLLPPASSFLAEFNGFIYFFISAQLGSAVFFIFGDFLNSYLISKTKIYTKGKYICSRFLIGSIFAILTDTILYISLRFFLGELSFYESCNVIVWAIGYKLLFVLIFSFPSALLSNFLKKTKSIDNFDLNVDYNPFSLNLEKDGKGQMPRHISKKMV